MWLLLRRPSREANGKEAQACQQQQHIHTSPREILHLRGSRSSEWRAPSNFTSSSFAHAAASWAACSKKAIARNPYMQTRMRQAASRASCRACSATYHNCKHEYICVTSHKHANQLHSNTWGARASSAPTWHKMCVRVNACVNTYMSESCMRELMNAQMHKFLECVHDCNA